MDNPCTHHDALEFPDGQIVLVTHLREGQRASVLQLPAQPNVPMQRHILLLRKRDLSLTGSAIRNRAERCHGDPRDAGSGRRHRSAVGASIAEGGGSPDRQLTMLPENRFASSAPRVTFFARYTNLPRG